MSVYELDRANVSCFGPDVEKQPMYRPPVPGCSVRRWRCACCGRGELYRPDQGAANDQCTVVIGLGFVLARCNNNGPPCFDAFRSSCGGGCCDDRGAVHKLLLVSALPLCLCFRQRCSNVHSRPARCTAQHNSLRGVINARRSCVFGI